MTTRHNIAERTRKKPGRQPAAHAARANGPLVNGPADRSAPSTPAPAVPNAPSGLGGPSSDLFFDYQFKDRSLLALALTHSSLAYENNPEGLNDPGSDNERLEFLGDAVLGLVVAEALYRRLPALREGELTRLRASLVSSRHLAQVAQRIQLGPMLLLGRGEAHSGGQRKPALLADALEAVIAALYLDGGLVAARDFIHRHIIDPAEAGLIGALRSSEPFSGAVGDYKSALQERLQATGLGQPQYILANQSGPDHQKRFLIEVRVANGEGSPVALASAEGTTKKQAQQEAARHAFTSLLSGALSKAVPTPAVSPASLRAGKTAANTADRRAGKPTPPAKPEVAP